MEKEFIPYELALELKELGFDEPCFGFRKEDGTFEFFATVDRDNTNSVFYYYPTAPLYQQAFRWFREKYGYDVSIKKCTPSEYKFEIEQLFVEDNNYYFIDFAFSSYKETQLECLKKLIEIVKRKKL